MTDRCRTQERTIEGLEKYQRISQNLQQQVANLEDTVAGLNDQVLLLLMLPPPPHYYYD